MCSVFTGKLIETDTNFLSLAQKLISFTSSFFTFHRHSTPNHKQWTRLGERITKKIKTKQKHSTCVRSYHSRLNVLCFDAYEIIWHNSLWHFRHSWRSSQTMWVGATSHLISCNTMQCRWHSQTHIVKQTKNAEAK